MLLSARPQSMKMAHVFDPNRSSPTSPSFPHAFSGNPGGIRTGPPIKTFGGDDFGVASLRPAAIFEEETLEASRKKPAKKRAGSRLIAYIDTSVLLPYTITQAVEEARYRSTEKFVCKNTRRCLIRSCFLLCATRDLCFCSR
jgi:hypothetical protein